MSVCNRKPYEFPSHSILNTICDVRELQLETPLVLLLETLISGSLTNCSLLTDSQAAFCSENVREWPLAMISMVDVDFYWEWSQRPSHDQRAYKCFFHYLIFLFITLSLTYPSYFDFEKMWFYFRTDTDGKFHKLTQKLQELKLGRLKGEFYFTLHLIVLSEIMQSFVSRHSLTPFPPFFFYFQDSTFLQGFCAHSWLP